MQDFRRELVDVLVPFRGTLVPVIFGHTSVTRGAMLLACFVWDRDDSVGIPSNPFPFLVALYPPEMRDNGPVSCCD